MMRLVEQVPKLFVVAIFLLARVQGRTLYPTNGLPALVLLS
jgi:hypothetical protein